MRLDSGRDCYPSSSSFSLTRISVFAVLLFCVFVFVSGTAAAQGSGSVAVSDFEDLQSVSDNPTLDYVLANDIDASGEEGFEPIGDEEEPFTGTFDGDGYTVSGLTVNRTDEDNVGLFGYVGSGGTVTNLGVEGVEVTGAEAVGGITGYNQGTVRRSHVTGSVRGVSSVGGLVGRNLGTVIESHTSVDVSGEDNVGGIVGRNSGAGEISESYATGSATGGTDVGGAVGNNGGEIAESYAMVEVSGNATLGGLVGANVGGVIQRTYSTGTVSATAGSGGFVGDNRGDVFESYWDSEASNQGSSSAGVALTTDEMTGMNAPRNMDLDFGETWVRRDEGYPALAWDVRRNERTRNRRTTQTGDDSTGETSGDDSDGTEETEEEDETPLPGFGGLVAIAALLVSGALLRRKGRLG